MALRIEVKSINTGEQTITPNQSKGQTFTAFTKISQTAYVHGLCDQNGWRKREVIPDTREFIDGVENPDFGIDTNAPVDCGAIIVIDECQRFFRPRPAGAKVPEYVQAFEVHRKQGLDFWLISQRPGQVDSHVRGLCEKHYGIWANWFGRFLYEWSQVHNIDSKAERDSVGSAVSRTALMDEELKRWTPVVPGRPETSPAYAELRHVSAMPQKHPLTFFANGL